MSVDTFWISTYVQEMVHSYIVHKCGSSEYTVCKPPWLPDEYIHST